MILAVRMVVEGMVEDFIKFDVDINMIDEWGRFIVCFYSSYLYVVLRLDISLFMSGLDLY